VRYTGPAIVLGLAAAGFLAAIWLAAGALSIGRTGQALLLALALTIASFVVAAWGCRQNTSDSSDNTRGDHLAPDESR
jgi:hypothetical protein